MSVFVVVYVHVYVCLCVSTCVCICMCARACKLLFVAAPPTSAISLGHNRISPQGAATLATLLHTNTTLKWLR